MMERVTLSPPNVRVRIVLCRIVDVGEQMVKVELYNELHQPPHV